MGDVAKRYIFAIKYRKEGDFYNLESPTVAKSKVAALFAHLPYEFHLSPTPTSTIHQHLPKPLKALQHNEVIPPLYSLGRLLHTQATSPLFYNKATKQKKGHTIIKCFKGFLSLFYINQTNSLILSHKVPYNAFLRAKTSHGASNAFA